MGKFSRFFTGKRAKTEQIPIFAPEHIPALNELLSLLMGQKGGQGQEQGQAGMLSDFFGAEKSFEPIAQQARTQFQQQTVPSIAERFSAMDGQRSSAFPQMLGQAGSQLEQGLASEGAKFGQRERALQVPLLQSLLGLAFQPRFQTSIQPGTSGFLGNAAQSIPGFVKMFGGFK